MKKGMYVRYDTVAEEIVPPIIVAKTKQETIRSLTIPTIKEYPLKDIQVLKIGTLETSTGEIINVQTEKVNWDIYSLPVDNEEAVKPLGINTKKMLDKEN